MRNGAGETDVGYAGERVGHHALHDVAPGHHARTGDEGRPVEGPVFAQLGQEVGRTQNRSRDEPGKESHENGEAQQGVLPLYLPSVQIDGVCHRLQGVEGDSQRQDYVQRIELPVTAKSLHARLRENQ